MHFFVILTKYTTMSKWTFFFSMRWRRGRGVGIFTRISLLRIIVIHWHHLFKKKYPCSFSFPYSKLLIFASFVPNSKSLIYSFCNISKMIFFKLMTVRRYGRLNLCKYLPWKEQVSPIHPGKQSQWPVSIIQMAPFSHLQVSVQPTPYIPSGQGSWQCPPIQPAVQLQEPSNLEKKG